jgi:hypothetical protein
MVLLIYATPFTTRALGIPYGNVISTLALVLIPVAAFFRLTARG